MLRAKKFCLFAILCSVGCAQSDESIEPNLESEDSGADAGTRSDPTPATASMYVHSGDTLYVVNDQDFALIEVGPFNADGSMMDMAVPPDGDIYTVSYDAVYQVDKETGTATHRADVSSGNMGMTFLPNGTLLAADNAGGVRIIDPANGAVTEIGSFGNGYALAGDLVAVANGTMYGVADKGPSGDEATNNVLVTVDTSTGEASPIGPIGFATVYGIAVANDKVYAFTQPGEIIEIDPQSGVGTLVASYPEISFYGAGVNPQAVID